MTKLRRLQKEAIESCNFRGHVMENFKTFNMKSCDAKISSSCCKLCGLGVTITTNPAPNEIDIMGEAVALNCSF